MDPAGESPAHRLTRSTKGESGAAFAANGDLYFTSSRPDPEGEEDEPRTALWLIPARGGEARVVLSRPGGVASVHCARAADRVVVTAGLLPPPLRDRFGFTGHMEFYAPEELERVIHRSARLLDVEIDTAGAAEIAGRSRGTPRIANRLLRRVRDYAQVRADGVINREVAGTALQVYEVDGRGLDRLDRRLSGQALECDDPLGRHP